MVARHQGQDGKGGVVRFPGGRNPPLTLLAIDGTSGTLDPAFEAQVAPISNWATARWGSPPRKAKVS